MPDKTYPVVFLILLYLWIRSRPLLVHASP
jgi:hypothetical protein